MTNTHTKFLKLITDVPDFPKPGIIFKDISPLLASEWFPELIQELAELVRESVNENNITRIAGIESRGFILGAALAHEMNIGFIPVRKEGKLPPPTVRHSYALEYGTDTIEVKAGTGSVIIIDDVLATGGTLTAAATALTAAGYTVTDIAVLMDLKFLNRFEWQGRAAKSLFAFS